MAKTCSPWCDQAADDPACRSCRLAPLGPGETGEAKLRQALAAVLFELKFYEKEVDVSTDLPFSFQVNDTRAELLDTIGAMRGWAETHLNEVEGRKQR
ncbi:hypothetical protein GCM10009854_29210 [Saccharopolyspora halophila]|uniref:Transcriptional regulator n=2 Tax=Saccharopolyspora halophila TaxID=405551 RepID=A0ABN3GE48_9PSEU